MTMPSKREYVGLFKSGTKTQPRSKKESFWVNSVTPYRFTENLRFDF